MQLRTREMGLQRLAGNVGRQLAGPGDCVRLNHKSGTEERGAEGTIGKSPTPEGPTVDRFSQSFLSSLSP